MVKRYGKLRTYSRTSDPKLLKDVKALGEMFQNMLTIYKC